MTALLWLYRDLCLLRRGPQDVPYSETLLLLVIAAALGVRVATGFAVDLGWAVLPRAAVELSLVGLMVHLLLRSRELLSRRTQTLCALFGTQTVLALMALPLTRILYLARDDQSQVPPLVALAWLALFCWSFVVAAHVHRHALGFSFAGGMLIAVSLFGLTAAVDVLLFVGGSPEASP